MPSTVHLALATTVAVHLIFAIVVDAIGIIAKEKDDEEPTRISVVDIDTSKLRPRPPPPPVVEEKPPEVLPEVVATQPQPQPSEQRRRTAARTQPQVTQPRATEPPPETDQPSGGGDPVYRLPVGGTEGRGPEVARGQRVVGRTGDGGSGGGKGGGTGGGEGDGAGPPKRPPSIVAIKVKAKPRGNFDYFDAGKNYPAEARRLGVEGLIKAKLIVDETGKVTKVTLITKLGHGLDQLAIARGYALEFDPARDAEDKPVSSIVVWEFTFTLPK